MRRIGLSPINLNDIPNTIKEFLNRIISITFPTKVIHQMWPLSKVTGECLPLRERGEKGFIRG